MFGTNYTQVWGFEGAIRGMRHPFKSTTKSDSGYRYIESSIGDDEAWYQINSPCHDDGVYIYVIGDNDLKLAKNLANAGTDHGKFLRMIHVQTDITAPLYWWKQLDTYKVGTVANSESTMHTIMKYPFSVNQFSVTCEQDIIGTVNWLNELRAQYLAETDEEKKQTIWNRIIELLPESYVQKRTWDANYAVLRSIYHARKNHKLKEWHIFCDWIEELPYSELITGREN